MKHQIQHHITFSKATPQDVAFLIANIRPEDRYEIEHDGFFNSYEEAIRWSVANSEVLFSAKCGGTLLLLYGAAVDTDQALVASIWGLGTTELRKHAREFVRSTKDGLAILANSMPDIRLFINAMPERFTTYRKWAERHLGAEFADFSNIMSTGERFTSFGIWRKGA